MINMSELLLIARHAQPNRSMHPTANSENAACPVGLNEKRCVLVSKKAPEKQVVLEKSSERFPGQIVGSHSTANASAFLDKSANAHSEEERALTEKIAQAHSKPKSWTTCASSEKLSSTRKSERKPNPKFTSLSTQMHEKVCQ